MSWDSANGDPLYRSDATLNYLKTQAKVKVTNLLAQQGATVFLEGQTANAQPVQEPYDALFGYNEVRVITNWRDPSTIGGTDAHVAKRFQASAVGRAVKLDY